MEGPSAQAGFFGKLPSHGDFVVRDLPSEFVAPWDRWLQAGIAASRHQLGEGAWLDAYLTAPIWRFCLQGGLCGPSAWLGILLPSLDRVGRYFPLTGAISIPGNWSLFGTALAARHWLRDLEGRLVAVLEAEDRKADALRDHLRALGAPSLDFGDQPPEACRENQGLHLRFGDPGDLDEAPGFLADALARRRWGTPFSLWWTSGSVQVAPNARLYPGLPEADAFGSLLRSDRPSEPA